MNIQPIVEGHGEVAAAPVLLRRLIAEAGVFQIDVNRPIRSRQSDLLRETSLKARVQLARRQPRCGAILVLFEDEDRCPRDLGPQLLAWAQAESMPVPCAIALAHREYEAWFLASIESLRGMRGIRPDADIPADPESVRDAKGALEARMDSGRFYAETLDQPALSGMFDMRLTYTRSRSFRHLVKVFGEVIAAMGADVSVWPPRGWVEDG